MPLDSARSSSLGHLCPALVGPQLATQRHPSTSDPTVVVTVEICLDRLRCRSLKLTCVLHQYFSSLERLRLAQDATGTSSRSPPPSRRSILPPNHLGTNSQCSSTRPDIFLHPGTHLEPRLFLNRTLLRKRRYRSTLHINSSSAAWFASLSPAAQRKLFSKEECKLYGQSNPSVILDAADETLRRRSWYPTLLLSDERRISDDPTIVDSEDFDPEGEDKVDSAIDMGDYSLDGFRWLDNETNIDLKLDDYHEAIAQTARRTASFSDVRVPAKRKTSLSSLSMRRGRSSTSSSRPQLAAPTLDPPATPALPTTKAINRSPSFSLRHIRSQASLASIDPRATHYQDPAARLKLRLYLASPQKFDEAVEFGFPSVKGDNQRVLARPMTSPQPFHDTNRTFFHDDTPELSGDEGDDADEPDTLYDPRTPEDPVFQMHRPAQKNSMDGNGSLRPFSLRRKTESYARGHAIDREMTLHMTLTRPDLRAPDDIPPVPPLTNTKINQIPLERPQLNLDGNPLSIWDTLPTEESKVKRFFRKFKLK